MELKNLFGKKLKKLREARGLTQQELAELCDMQTNSITLIEIGERAASFSTIELLAEKLGVSYAELFNFDFEEGFEPSKQKLLDYLNSELKIFDENLLQHMLQYSKLVKKLYSSKNNF